MNAQVERVMVGRAQQCTFDAKPLSKALGVEVAGLDLAQPIAREAIVRLRSLLADNCLLLFRDQRLTPEEHIAFSRNFGELQPHILKDFNLSGHPELFVVSNIKADGKAIGRAGAGQYWHTDVSYVEEPSLGSIMYAMEVPATAMGVLNVDLRKKKYDMSLTITPTKEIALNCTSTRGTPKFTKKQGVGMALGTGAPGMQAETPQPLADPARLAAKYSMDASTQSGGAVGPVVQEWDLKLSQ